jgi:ABC-2 type transport system permease protein
MIADVRRLAPPAAPPAVRLRRHRHGLGSVYAKTLRDSRRAIVIMAGLLGVLMLSGGAQYGLPYATPQARAALANTFRQLPAVMAGLYGGPLPANLETLGALIWIKDGAFAAITAGLWSILALSSTLATEVRRGSFELVAVTPLGLRRIVLQKLAAHLTAMALVLAVLAGAAWLACIAFGTVPGDAISVAAAGGFALWVGLIALASGSVAFALVPLIGRGSAAGIAGTVLVGGYLLNGYRAALPAVAGSAADATWFGWTIHHQPLASQFDWPALVPVALVAVVLFAVGVEVFVRRDLGDTSAIPWPRLPAAALGLGGPVARSLGERLPAALGWGVGFGLFGFVSGNAAGAFNSRLAAAAPEAGNLVRTLFPHIDFTAPGAFLQLAVVQIGLIFAGFAASTLVGGWAADESSGRLELLLTTPLARARWAVSSGLGVLAAVAVMTVLFALATGAGVALSGSDPAIPALGTAVLGLYAAALAGVGLAVGGLVRTSIAGEVVAAIVVVSFLIDLVGPALRLPRWVTQLPLAAHLGQPMLGTWDWAGMAACLTLAFAGLALSAWGIRRRDIAA